MLKELRQQLFTEAQGKWLVCEVIDLHDELVTHMERRTRNGKTIQEELAENICCKVSSIRDEAPLQRTILKTILMQQL